MGSQRRRANALRDSGRLDEFVRLYQTAASIEDVAAAFSDLFPTDLSNVKNTVAQVAIEIGVARPAHLRSATLPKVVADVPEVEPPVEDLQEQVRSDRRLAAAQAEARQLRRLYQEAIKASNSTERIVETLRDAVVAFPTVKQVPASSGPQERTGHTVVLHLSDWHMGEVVTAAETGGLGQYDMDIVARRLGLVAEKVVELVGLRRSALSVPRLKVFLGGDMVSGNIHDELAETNQVNIVQQTSEGAYMVAQMLCSIAPHFEEVEVVCVGGNHGRMHKKPRAKERELSFDYLMYQVVGFLVAKQPNVRMRISQSFYEIVDIDGFKVLLMHGDSIKGSMGIPFYGVERASSRMRVLLDMVKERFDVVMIGHFHDPVIGDRWITNGSGKGIDGYSAGMLHLGSQPSQNMLYVHPEYGIVATEKLFLSPADSRPELALQRALSEVWAEAT